MLRENRTPMKKFQDLYFHLNGTDIQKLVESLTRHCQSPWNRRSDKEDGIGGYRPYCFESVGNESLAAAALFLYENEVGVWYVSNIVPTVERELSHEQYNSLLTDFNFKVVTPAIQDLSVTANLTSDEISIGSVAGPEVEDALKRFSNLANKSTGTSHPYDRKRWMEFILLAQKSPEKPSVELVISTLIDLGWSEDWAYDLGIQFEFACDLLTFVKEQ